MTNSPDHPDEADHSSADDLRMAEAPRKVQAIIPNPAAKDRNGNCKSAAKAGKLR
jgi:hypothetical protein